jgi:hypothetical protein
MDEIMAQLRAAALKGEEEIENGDWARLPLPDAVFDQIVSPALEDQVLDAMVRCKLWIRLDGGFTFRYWDCAKGV